MHAELAVLDQQSERAGALGTRLLKECAGDIFPCDTLACSVLARTLNQIRGFKILMEAKSFNCAAPLLRLQLDSLLRLYGVTTCKEPHAIALQVCQGIPLRSIKHSNGGKMTDKHLQEMLAKAVPWVPEIYSLSSAYIHLSEQHFLHLLMQSSKDEHGTRVIKVSDEDEYVPEDHKTALVHTFARVTEAVLKLVEEWISRRLSVTNTARLKEVLRAV
jgi:hypothetical protein